jgi:DNA-binding transcriptional MocR family regulator
MVPRMVPKLVDFLFQRFFRWRHPKSGRPGGMRKGPGAARLAGIGTSIFTEITALAVERGAVNLGQGFPDFAAPGFVKEAAARHLREDRNQYAASPGLPRLRQALAEDYRRRWPARPSCCTTPSWRWSTRATR